MPLLNGGSDDGGIRNEPGDDKNMEAVVECCGAGGRGGKEGSVNGGFLCSLLAVLLLLT